MNHRYYITDGKRTRFYVAETETEALSMASKAKDSFFPRGVGLWCDGVGVHDHVDGHDFIFDPRAAFGGLNLIPS